MWSAFWDAFWDRLEDFWEGFWDLFDCWLHGCREAACVDDPEELEEDDYTGMEIEMSFSDALEEMKAGWRITRSSWHVVEGFRIYLYQSPCGHIIMQEKFRASTWVPNQMDVLAMDWMMLAPCGDPLARECKS